MERGPQAALVGSALALGLAGLVLTFGRPFLPGVVVVGVCFAAIGGLIVLVACSRNAMAAGSADGGRPWTWSPAARTILVWSAPLVLAAAAMMVMSFVALGKGSPSEKERGAGCEFSLVNKGVVTCVGKAEFTRAGAAEQALWMSWAAGFLAFESLGLVLLRPRDNAAPIWAGTRDLDWD